MASYADHLNVIKGFCDKADGKDKLTALIQYACLFISAGEPGNIKKIQASVTAARKVFRIMRPLELVTPLLIQPGFTGKQPMLVEAINKVKLALMAVYFGADHVVWAHQIGLITDKKVGERYQKLSLWSWALGSVCTLAAEGYSIAAQSVVRKEGESEEDYCKRVEEVKKQINQRLLVIVHALFQAALAAGLLQLLPLKPRTVGVLGVVASAINCYMLLPAYPKPAPPPKAKAQ
ncbi:Peroxisomal membrane protein 11D [Tetrabaena socialis]|uniref:Peroxisomal membrane protein 11D n=1 Tax=Tetrabaena socialis TaxID=47790 RepID=A0A2J8ABC2_9CHLO|nr:Peroxisomal membrane protein 11D [Tetrabaena socialis]|eukprot:PNH09763.1 Peroxisomal membrane protein 11D [Tetrabaena socialis]